VGSREWKLAERSVSELLAAPRGEASNMLATAGPARPLTWPLHRLNSLLDVTVLARRPHRHGKPRDGFFPGLAAGSKSNDTELGSRQVQGAVGGDATPDHAELSTPRPLSASEQRSLAGLVRRKLTAGCSCFRHRLRHRLKRQGRSARTWSREPRARDVRLHLAGPNVEHMREVCRACRLELPLEP